MKYTAFVLIPQTGKNIVTLRTDFLASDGMPGSTFANLQLRDKKHVEAFLQAVKTKKVRVE